MPRRNTAMALCNNKTTANNTMPRAKAKGKSPLLVSKAMAVVITRVKPSMLPPTTITAPTSAIARLKQAITTVSKAQRSSQAKSKLRSQADAPSDCNCSP